ncbi:MAG: bifunctional diaminohydroxyphosphoribosylaminopyrimidine deaminase/5-amino-6-(5-phosphoribosylamino)uracil reductase RibD [Gammaproteobacteria bacterium]|nr:bifunctional diaminohydroxyphosphoribosylaminopyrimidine deaminase/5-amino-6-(5-phosphoribosylamino)uracil reductase RibD [Gammaproteobacteria bacterium]
MGHHHFLLKALELANERRGFCSPNPSVGAVVVKNNEIIATGYHYGPGYDHAEVAASQQLSNFEDASLYVTLEPCCHWGKTPPCTDMILNKGIKAVYYGYLDPNPLVAGQGAQLLQSQGVRCEQISLPEINAFYKSYSHWVQTHRPWVTTKLAMSLDSKIADLMSNPVSITGQIAGLFTHQSRKKSDAILTSVRTIIQDDPSLNIRLGDRVIAKPLYVIDSKVEFPPSAKLMQTAAKITVFYSEGEPSKIKTLEELGITCHPVSQSIGHLHLGEILDKIGDDGVHDLWVEAGGKVFSAFASQQLAQKSFIYIAPKLLGKRALPAFNEDRDIFSEAKAIKWQNMGEDVVCEIDWE